MNKRTELFATALEQERRMLCHFHALGELLKENPISQEDFAKQYPRTYNAVMTDKPYSFDLPDKPYSFDLPDGKATGSLTHGLLR